LGIAGAGGAATDFRGQLAPALKLGVIVAFQRGWKGEALRQ
jgi:hypothetical protein